MKNFLTGILHSDILYSSSKPKHLKAFCQKHMQLASALVVSTIPMKEILPILSSYFPFLLKSCGSSVLQIFNFGYTKRCFTIGPNLRRDSKVIPSKRPVIG